MIHPLFNRMFNIKACCPNTSACHPHLSCFLSILNLKQRTGRIAPTNLLPYQMRCPFVSRIPYGFLPPGISRNFPTWPLTVTQPSLPSFLALVGQQYNEYLPCQKNHEVLLLRLLKTWPFDIVTQVLASFSAEISRSPGLKPWHGSDFLPSPHWVPLRCPMLPRPQIQPSWRNARLWELGSAKTQSQRDRGAPHRVSSRPHIAKKHVQSAEMTGYQAKEHRAVSRRHWCIQHPNHPIISYHLHHPT